MTGDHEVAVLFRSYSNPRGRCLECGGGSEPGCCDVLFPVPQDQNCLVDLCDTALTYCFIPVGSTEICQQSEQTLAPRALLNTRGSTFDRDFFGLANPVVFNRSESWQVDTISYHVRS